MKRRRSNHAPWCELRQVAGLALADNDSVMCAAGADHCGETSQAVDQHTGARGEGALGPPREGWAGGTGRGSRLNVEGIALIVEQNRRHERHCVLRASTKRAADALAAEVRVINLHSARQAMYSPEPGHRVTNANLAPEVERRQAGLGADDQVNRKEPRRQQQPSILEQRAVNDDS